MGTAVHLAASIEYTLGAAPLFLMALCYYTAWMYHNLFNHSPVDGYLVCFQHCDGINNNVKNISVNRRVR